LLGLFDGFCVGVLGVRGHGLWRRRGLRWRRHDQPGVVDGFGLVEIDVDRELIELDRVLVVTGVDDGFELFDQRVRLELLRRHVRLHARPDG